MNCQSRLSDSHIASNRTCMEYRYHRLLTDMLPRAEHFSQWILFQSYHLCRLNWYVNYSSSWISSVIILASKCYALCFVRTIQQKRAHANLQTVRSFGTWTWSLVLSRWPELTQHTTFSHNPQFWLSKLSKEKKCLWRLTDSHIASNRTRMEYRYHRPLTVIFPRATHFSPWTRFQLYINTEMVFWLHIS